MGKVKCMRAIRKRINRSQILDCEKLGIKIPKLEKEHKNLLNLKVKQTLRCGINPESEHEYRKERYFNAIANKISAKKERAKLLHAWNENNEIKVLEAEIKESAKKEEITAYCIKNECSRKVARKRMSKERKSAGKAAA